MRVFQHLTGGPGRGYSEEAFRCLLAIEQERSKRSARPFFLLLIDMKEQPEAGAGIDAMMASALFDSVSRGIRETDFVGWYAEGRIVGAVLTNFEHANGAGIAPLIVQRLRTELRRRLSPSALDRLQLRFYQRPTGLKLWEMKPTMGAARQDRGVRGYVINEDVFRGIAIKERLRTDRSSQPFVLVLVSASGSGEIPLLTWSAVIDALTAVKRESDIMGWFKLGTSLGLISTEIRALTAIAVDTIEARVRRELADQLTPEVLSKLSIQLYAQQASKNGGQEAVPEADAILERLCASQIAPSAYDATKRTLDIVGSATLLVTLAPVLLVIGVFVKLTSRGPILFRQVRVGEMASSFTMLKFRTMKVDAGPALHQEFVTRLITSAGTVDLAANNGLFKIVHDPRVTPVGSVLRRTSLDELPQLWNVLRGDMSLVGPRPPLHYEVQQYQPWHHRRFQEAKPGLTGLWQVTGRSRTTFDEMVRLDLRYARTRSLWTDIRILLATPAAAISGKGAC